MNSKAKGGRGEIMKEVWKPILGYEGLYEASSFGNISSLKRATTNGRILKQYINTRNGYCYVSLSKNNNAKTCRVHKLIYMAFHPESNLSKEYNKAETIDHIDGNKTNNRLDNLEVCTQSENQLRAYKLGINGKSTRKVIDLTTGIIYESCGEASKSVGTKKNYASAVIRVCQGKRSQYRNHRFAYYDDFVKGTIPKFEGRSKESCKRLWVK